MHFRSRRGFLKLSSKTALTSLLLRKPLWGVEQKPASSETMSTLSLSGDQWNVFSFEPGQGVIRRAFAEGYEVDEAIQATVPGDIHWDLERAERIPSLFFGLNSSQNNIGWIWQKEWWYRRDFPVPPAWRNRSVRLHFDGVDYESDVWLNGFHLGHHEGAYTPFDFEVSRYLRFDRKNTLNVKIHPVPEGIVHSTRSFRSSYRYSKCQSEIGWDFAPRIITMGIPKEIRLIASDGVFLSQPLVFPSLSSTFDLARLHIKVNAQADRTRTVDFHMRVHLRGSQNASVATVQRALLSHAPRQVDFEMQLPNPQLWWPNGYGEQPLYDLEVRVCAAGQTRELHRVHTSFGVRDLQILANPSAPENADYFDYERGQLVELPASVPAQRYLIQINGRKIFARGGNWVPADALSGRPDRSFYEHLVRSAAEANFNFLRIWGGGVLEKQDLYELCDQYGIMIDQEFFCGGAGYLLPETEDRLSVSAEETRAFLPLWINHPSIVRYCGGNEMYIDRESSRQMAQLRSICDEVDPTRPYYDPDPILTAQRHGEYEFLYPRNYRMYNEGLYRFSGTLNPCEWTEFGVGGLSSVATLKSIFPPDILWPIDENNPQWRHHKAFGAAVMKDNWAGISGAHALFGNAVSDLDTLVRCSQYTQAEGLRCACSSMRRFRWHRSACAIWSYNEPWPNAAQGCIVEYSGTRKMAYYSLKRAYAPIDFFAYYDTLETVDAGSWKPGLKLWGEDARFPAALCIVCDHAKRISGYKARYRILDLRGKTWLDRSIDVDLPAEGTLELGRIDWIAPREITGDMALLWLELFDDRGNTVARNFHPFGVKVPGTVLPGPLAGLLTAPRTELIARVIHLARSDKGHNQKLSLEIRNAGKAAALLVSIEEPDAFDSIRNSYPASRKHSSFEDNYFFLPPGEARTIEILCPQPLPSDIRIKAWNSDPVTVSLRG